MLEWLKEVMGEQYTEEIEKKISEDIGKNFVARSDFNAANEAKKALEEQIAERDRQLEELKQIDAAGLQAEIERLQGENATQKAEAEQREADLMYNHAIDQYVTGSGLKFSSKGAQKAFTEELREKGLKLDNGQLLGVDDFTKSYKEADPGAFASDEAVAKVITSTKGGALQATDTMMEAARTAAGLSEQTK